MSRSVTPHAQPFYCPWCGEQDFVPYGDGLGRFVCHSCNRHYIVKFLGLASHNPTFPSSDVEEGST